MNWADVLGNGIYIYENRDKYAYLYGAKGQLLTAKLIREFFAMYPDYFKQYSDNEKRDIIEFSEGKTGLDCSGYINQCCGQVNWSTGYYEQSLNKTTPALGTWGNILYTTFGGKGRHIGLDVGEGKFLHAPKELHSIELGIIKEYPWEGSGQIKGVSYTLAGNK